MQSGKSYIKDYGHFSEKIKALGCMPDDVILVKADVVGLYPSIAHQAGLIGLREGVEVRLLKNIPIDDLIKMTEFVLSNNFLKFNGDPFQQISGMTIGTNFALPYVCICMDQFEQNFPAMQINQPLIWLRYIDDIFLYGLMGKEKEKNLCQVLIVSLLISSSGMSLLQKDISFLDIRI